MDLVIYIALYSLCVFGLVTNFLIIYVIFRYSVLKRVSNIYTLDLIMCNILGIVWIVFHITEHHLAGWQFGDLWCKASTYLAHISFIAASFFITIITLERFLAICRPYALNYLQTYTIASLVSGAIWVFSAIVRVPTVVATKVEDAMRDDRPEQHCHWSKPTEYQKVTLAVCFTANLLVVILLYFAIMLKFHKSDVEGTTGMSASIRRKETYLLFSIVILYLFTWTPYWILDIISKFSSNFLETSTRRFFKDFCIFLSLIYCIFCPIVYIAYGKNFPQCFRKLFGISKPLRPHVESTIQMTEVKE